jgi:hypothetical protein
MNKKLLLSLTNGILLVSFCNVEKAVGAVSPLPQGKKQTMKEKHFEDEAEMEGLEFEFQKTGGFGGRQLMKPIQKAKLPAPPPPPQEETRKIVQVICNKRVLEVYNLPDCYSHNLWRAMTTLTETIAKNHNWRDSKGERNLIYYLAEMYKTADQNTKDAIALYFLDTSGRCAGELAGGDDEDAEQEAIDFTCKCLLIVEK